MDRSNIKTVTIMIGWFVANVTTVILNKHIFQNLEWKYPITLTIVHMITCLVGSVVSLRILKTSNFVDLSYQEWLKGAVPLSVIFCFNIVLGNVSLKYVSVSFMQTIKSSVPFFTVALETLWLKVDQKDKRVFHSLIPIVGGVMLASWTEVEFDMTGFLAALLASVISALLSIMTSKLLQTNLDSPNLLYYMSPLSAGMLIPISLFSESASIIKDAAARTAGPSLVITLIMSGMVAFALNMLTFLLINNTSALTYTVVGNVKVIFSILFSVILLQNSVGLGSGLGCLITLAGAAWYSQIKYHIKMMAAHALPK